MRTYVGLLKWTSQGLSTVKESLNRRRQATERIEQMGGRLVATYWTQGAYDVILIAEFPDDETASAFFLATGLQGAVRSETMRAYNEQEMQRIIQKLG